MKLQNAESVKGWLRGLPLLKKELEMRIAFYSELAKESRKVSEIGDKHLAYYLTQIERLQPRMQTVLREAEKLLDTLLPEERAVLHARYLRRYGWDAMEFQVHYSRRQAIRIHNRAIDKLIGMEVECGFDDGE